MSQEEAAERADVSQAFVSAVERGHCPQSIRAAIRLARALGTTVEQLFGADAVVPSPGRGQRRIYKSAPCPGATEAA